MGNQQTLKTSLSNSKIKTKPCRMFILRIFRFSNCLLEKADKTYDLNWLHLKSFWNKEVLQTLHKCKKLYTNCLKFFGSINDDEDLIYRVLTHKWNKKSCKKLKISNSKMWFREIKTCQKLAQLSYIMSGRGRDMTFKCPFLFSKVNDSVAKQPCSFICLLLPKCV